MFQNFTRKNNVSAVLTHVRVFYSLSPNKMIFFTDSQEEFFRELLES